MAPIGDILFNGPQEYDEWCHVCSVVALDWVDLTNVASGIFITSVTGSILTLVCAAMDRSSVVDCQAGTNFGHDCG